MTCWVSSAIVVMSVICLISGTVSATDKSALIIIDVQNCFTPGGTLVVPGGERVIPVINEIRKRHSSLFDVIALSQDWHCPKHVSFASQHPGYSVNDAIELSYNAKGELCHEEGINAEYSVTCTGAEKTKFRQILWPDHCMANTSTADFHPELVVDTTDFIVKKATTCQLDAYSAFYDNGRFRKTPLDNYLKNEGITNIYVTGLAIEYCVYFTAKDGKELGYNTFVVLDATHPFHEESSREPLAQMAKLGIHLINSTDIGRTSGSRGFPAMSGFLSPLLALSVALCAHSGGY